MKTPAVPATPICDACETVAHCTRHGCIPPSQHAAMDRVLRAMAMNLDQPHSTPSRCELLGVGQGHTPPCAGCIEAAAPRTDEPPTLPPWDWIERLRAPALWLAFLAGSVAGAMAVVTAKHFAR